MLVNKLYNPEITSSSTLSNEKTNFSLKYFYENEDYDKLIVFLKSTNLESIGITNILSKIFSNLDNKILHDKIFEILKILANYKINVFEYELKEGIRLLIQMKKLEWVVEIITILIEKEKIIDEYLISSLIVSCFNSADQSLLESCFKIIVAYYKLNQNISHTFWQTSIEGLIKIKKNSLALKLLKIYPIKYSYSESLWRRVIISSLTNEENIQKLFELFDNKFLERTSKDDFRAFENIYNIFIDEMATLRDLISSLDNIYDTILKRKINLKESVVEKFFVSMVSKNLNNYEKIENLLLKSDCIITAKIIEKIILTYSQLNEFVPIFTILKLCKSQKIPVPYDSLSIPANTMKELIKFIIDKTELALDIELYSGLSNDNKSYVSKNFKCLSNSSFINISESLENEVENGKIISQELSEKSEFTNEGKVEVPVRNTQSLEKEQIKENNSCKNLEEEYFIY